MSKYNNITEGMKVVDVSLSEDGYNYYGFVRSNGEWAIMRENTAQTEYRFSVGGSDYSTNWTNRASLGYRLPTIG